MKQFMLNVYMFFHFWILLLERQGLHLEAYYTCVWSVFDIANNCGYHTNIFYSFHSHMQHVFLLSRLFYSTDVNSFCKYCAIKVD